MLPRLALRLSPLFLPLFLFLSAAPARADGIVIIDPPCIEGRPCPPWPPPVPRPIPLAIKVHRVQVTIEDQVAVTRVDQVFRNDNDFTVEGVYVFPLPEGAAVTSFSLWMDGEEVEGKVLDKDEARRIYEDIVRSLRDPALLEYVGQGLVQASVFPIAPGEERRVELEYSQVLPVENGLVHYLYPLNTEKFSSQPLEQVSVSVSVTSRNPVRAIYSPSHKIAVSRGSDFSFSVGYEENEVTPTTDFELYYSVDSEAIGLNLLTFRDPTGADPDGFFLLLAAPSFQPDPQGVIAKDILLVLDQSGSMEGAKFQQAQDALQYVLDHLNPEDRVNIVAFSTGSRHFAGDLRPAGEVPEAKAWVDRLIAEGGTDINRALLEAMQYVETGRPAILIFLTDGLPTEGETAIEAILNNVQQAAPENARLFAFGVGDDVDTVLLDTLAEQNHGASAYVRPNQRIDEEISAFYQKVSAPVLTHLELDFGPINTFDMYPQTLPDLFAGSQLVLLGRYSGEGPATVEMRGLVNEEQMTFSYPDQTFRESGGPDFLPRLWATRKIGHLLNQIRLHGPQPELVDQVVRLSIRYGIVTPYTSYLVTEDELLGVDAQSQLADEQLRMLQAAPREAVGGAAVTRAQEQADLQGSLVAASPEAEARGRIALAGDRTYLFQGGVWIDTLFDPDGVSPVPVAFVSDDYFRLLGARPELALALALGERVIVEADGVFYEVVEAAQTVDPLVIPPTHTPGPVSQVEPVAETPAPVGTPVPNGSSGPGSCTAVLPAMVLAALPVLVRRKAMR